MTSTQLLPEIEVIQTYYTQIKDSLLELESYNVNLKELKVFEENMKIIADNILSNSETPNLQKQINKLKLIQYEIFEVLISQKVKVIDGIIQLNSDILDKYVPGFYNTDYPLYRETKRALARIDSNSLDNSFSIINQNLPSLIELENKLTDCNPLLIKERRVNNIKDRRNYIIGFLTALVVALAAILFKEYLFPDNKDINDNKDKQEQVMEKQP